MVTYPKGMVKRKRGRSREHFAKFENGYTKGWAFDVPEVFKDSLDIKKVWLVKRDENNKIIKDADGISLKEHVYTQGISFDFETGSTFYSDKLAYIDWNKFVDSGGIALQVDAATSAGWEVIEIEKEDDTEKMYLYFPGYIAMTVLKKVNGKFDIVMQKEITAVELVNILWHGLDDVFEKNNLKEQMMDGRYEQCQPLGKFRNKELYDRHVDELIGLCRGVSADGVINQGEAEYLAKWLESNRDYKNAYPFNIFYSRISEMLKDGILDDEESRELLEICKSFTGENKEELSAHSKNLSTSLPLDTPPPDIFFEDMVFCFTGVFTVGPRRHCENLVKEKGGKVSRGITRNTDYLIVGDLGSDQWVHSSYGRKIETALGLKEKGFSVAIVSEHHWIKFV